MAIKRGKVLSNMAGLSGPITHYAIYTWEDIANNATSSNQTTIATIPAGGGLYLAMVHEETALAGASDITLDVGTTANDPHEFIDNLDVDAMTVPIYNQGQSFEASNAEGLCIVGETATDKDVLVEWNGTVANLTAGRVIIALGIVDPAGVALG